jgi:hypothetical protein
MKLKLNTEEVAAVPEVRPAPFSDRIPSNWDIEMDGDVIRARNTVSLEVFRGTMAEFNDRLRG